MAHQSSSSDVPVQRFQPQSSRIHQVGNEGVANNQIEDETTNGKDTNQERTAKRRWIATVSYVLLSMLEVIVLFHLLFRLRELMKMGRAWRNP